jgi:hypothetical protein
MAMPVPLVKSDPLAQLVKMVGLEFQDQQDMKVLAVLREQLAVWANQALKALKVLQDL